MDVEVLKENETPLLSRKRYTLKIESTGATPSRKELIKAVSAKIKSNPNLTIIKHIYPQFGGKYTKLIAHVYKDMDALEKIEHEYLIKKHKDEKKKDENPAQADAKPAEAKE
ncbi:hypothetical protein JW968_00915 [Candidatus Woesearchaeota archaeon]|nr:hypothetical protein [Candidatus Woesearchaeota archaeon]